jgi:hypothetical protein
MGKARYFLTIGLLAAATQVQGATGWLDDQINVIVGQVQDTFDLVRGDIKQAAQNLVGQAKRRTDAMRDNVDDLVTWFQNRETPLRDFVSGGVGRCATGSPCAGFRTDLKTFALQMAELKDRFPALQQHGLGDTRLFADLVNILPPIALFGLHEILKLIPDCRICPSTWPTSSTRSATPRCSPPSMKAPSWRPRASPVA